MITILDLLKEQQIHPGRVYSEPPTLNDVFLAITGKNCGLIPGKEWIRT